MSLRERLPWKSMREEARPQRLVVDKKPFDCVVFFSISAFMKWFKDHADPHRSTSLCNPCGYQRVWRLYFQEVRKWERGWDSRFGFWWRREELDDRIKWWRWGRNWDGGLGLSFDSGWSKIFFLGFGLGFMTGVYGLEWDLWGLPRAPQNYRAYWSWISLSSLKNFSFSLHLKSA